VLTITKSDQGMHFRQGQTAKMVYTILVHNSGPGPTGGKISVSDTLPAGLTGNAVSPGAGTGWTCTGTATVTCTSEDTIAAGSDYPLITLSVDVAANAASSPGNPTHLVSNTATVIGGGSSGTVTSSPPTSTFVEQVADLAVTKTHSGPFIQGDTAAANDIYTITVNNLINHGPTLGASAPVTLADTLPTGLTAISMSGTNWVCDLPTTTCTSNDVIQSGSNFPAITLQVSVAINTATPTVTNSATVSGGGELNTANDTTTDPTTITPAPNLQATKTNNVSNATNLGNN
jgi:uncharacterized repeat protein (TIGR01451 family)